MDGRSDDVLDPGGVAALLGGFHALHRLAVGLPFERILGTVMVDFEPAVGTPELEEEMLAFVDVVAGG